MPKENITKFIDAALTDQVLAGKVAALAAASGYGFTAAELLALGAARPISDEELESVPGGLVDYLQLRQPAQEKNRLPSAPKSEITLSGGPIKGDPFGDTFLA